MGGMVQCSKRSPRMDDLSHLFSFPSIKCNFLGIFFLYCSFACCSWEFCLGELWGVPCPNIGLLLKWYWSPNHWPLFYWFNNQHTINIFGPKMINLSYMSNLWLRHLQSAQAAADFCTSLPTCLKVPFHIWH